MEMLVLALLVASGLAASALMVITVRRQLASGAPAPPSSLPPVSILKPLKGADPGLAENLESFFRLDYPQYELLFGVDDPADPACALALRAAAAHPAVPSRLVTDARKVGINPKVNNLANLLRHAHHELIWISDSNTRVPPDTLGDLVNHLERPGTGLVSSPFRGVGWEGFGGACESLQLNTFVMGGVSTAHRVLRQVCVVGKSMVLRRSTLAAFGGFSFLAQYLAEDQVCGEEVARLGQGVALAGRPVDNVLGRLGVRAFIARHLRWAKIRHRMNPAAYAAELLLNPVFVAACGVVVERSSSSLVLFAVVLLLKSALDAAAEYATGVRKPLLTYPPLTVAKDLVIGLAWLVPFLSASVMWRGNRFRLGPRTLLTPTGAAAHAVLGSASPAGVKG